jgi:hypothetical protein
MAAQLPRKRAKMPSVAVVLTTIVLSAAALSTGAIRNPQLRSRASGLASRNAAC